MAGSRRDAREGCAVLGWWPTVEARVKGRTQVYKRRSVGGTEPAKAEGKVSSCVSSAACRVRHPSHGPSDKDGQQ
jgi:hypothetical protein